ncbi:MAG: hypothetical protein CMK59_05280, partial [Proteobacteria bacterium]|nr:hypothetical protein [Pseudomonadota bacterium]
MFSALLLSLVSSLAQAEPPVSAPSKLELPLPLAADGAKKRTDDGSSEPSSTTTTTPTENKTPPSINGAQKVTLDFTDTPLTDMVEFMAKITGRNFILTNELKGKVTIISHRQVTVPEAWEAFLSALETLGYTTVAVGKNTKIIQTNSASNSTFTPWLLENVPK